MPNPDIRLGPPELLEEETKAIDDLLVGSFSPKKTALEVSRMKVPKEKTSSIASLSVVADFFSSSQSESSSNEESFKPVDFAHINSLNPTRFRRNRKETDPPVVKEDTKKESSDYAEDETKDDTSLVSGFSFQPDTITNLILDIKPRPVASMS